MSRPAIDRSFIRLAEGQLHLRSMAAAAEGELPLLLFHLSPLSSRSLVPLMHGLRDAGLGSAMIAPDTLGNGDSAPPALDAPDIAYFADSMVRLLDALGIGRCNLFGTHTGARIACELAASHPDRVSKLILDGITEYSPDTQANYSADYLPNVEPDDYGRQFLWGFHYMRDQHLFAPYYRREKDYRLARDIPSAEQLHEDTLDLMKALPTYRQPYRAAFAYPAFTRAARVQAPALLLKPEDAAPALNAAADRLATIIPDASAQAVGADLASHARAILAFLNPMNGASA